LLIAPIATLALVFSGYSSTEAQPIPQNPGGPGSVVTPSPVFGGYDIGTFGVNYYATDNIKINAVCINGLGTCSGYVAFNLSPSVLGFPVHVATNQVGAGFGFVEQDGFTICTGFPPAPTATGCPEGGIADLAGNMSAHIPGSTQAFLGSYNVQICDADTAPGCPNAEVSFTTLPQDVIVLSICNRAHIGAYCGFSYPAVVTEEWFCPDVIGVVTPANCAEVNLRPFNMGP
jgi:hypothetical protein